MCDFFILLLLLLLFCELPREQNIVGDMLPHIIVSCLFITFFKYKWQFTEEQQTKHIKMFSCHLDGSPLTKSVLMCLSEEDVMWSLFKSELWSDVYCACEKQYLQYLLIERG